MICNAKVYTIKLLFSDAEEDEEEDGTEEEDDTTEEAETSTEAPVPETSFLGKIASFIVGDEPGQEDEKKDEKNETVPASKVSQDSKPEEAASISESSQKLEVNATTDEQTNPELSNQHLNSTKDIPEKSEQVTENVKPVTEEVIEDHPTVTQIPIYNEIHAPQMQTLEDLQITTSAPMTTTAITNTTSELDDKNIKLSANKTDDTVTKPEIDHGIPNFKPIPESIGNITESLLNGTNSQTEPEKPVVEVKPVETKVKDRMTTLPGTGTEIPTPPPLLGLHRKQPKTEGKSKPDISKNTVVAQDKPVSGIESTSESQNKIVQQKEPLTVEKHNEMDSKEAEQVVVPPKEDVHSEKPKDIAVETENSEVEKTTTETTVDTSTADINDEKSAPEETKKADEETIVEIENVEVEKPVTEATSESNVVSSTEEIMAEKPHELAPEENKKVDDTATNVVNEVPEVKSAEEKKPVENTINIDDKLDLEIEKSEVEETQKEIPEVKQSPEPIPNPSDSQTSNEELPISKENKIDDFQAKREKVKRLLESSVPPTGKELHSGEATITEIKGPNERIPSVIEVRRNGKLVKPKDVEPSKFKIHTF